MASLNLKTVLTFKNELNMKNKKLKMMNLFAKCSAFSTPLKCSASSTPLKCSSSSTTPAQPVVKKNEAAQPTSFSEEILEEQRILFGGFIDEVVGLLYLPPHRQEVKLGQWLHVTNLAVDVSVLFPGKHDIFYNEKKNSFEYLTEREEIGEFLLMEKGFLHLLNEEKVGFMAYFDVVEKKKKILKEAEEKEKEEAEKKEKEAEEAKKKKN